MLLLLSALLAAAAAQDYRSPHADSLIYFEMKPVDLAASGSYSLLLHDIDRDGNNDLVLLSYAGTTAGESPGEVYWYRWVGVAADGTPQWAKRLVARKMHVVYASFLDVDGDGYDDMVFNSDFEVPPEDVAPQGSFWCALNPGPGNYDSEWELVYIGRVVGNHRTAAADFDGDGFEETVAIPLFSPGDEPYYGPATIVLFEPPRPWSADGEWRNSTLSAGKFLNPHDVAVVPAADGKRHSILISAHEGIYRLDITRDDDSGEYSAVATELHSFPVDDPSDDYARDVGFKPLPQDCEDNPDDLHGVTALTKNVKDISSLPYMATIDYTNTTGILPGQVWHGDQVSLYFPADGKTVVEPGLTRKVLEKRYSGGHTAVVFDFDSDGCADVVAGFREYPTAMVLYRCIPDEAAIGGVSFRKQILSERGTNAIVLDDFDRDGFMDMATVGFGGMSGEGGDPYVLTWLYRGDSIVSATGTATDSSSCSDNDDSFSDTVMAAVISLVVILAAAVATLSYLLYRSTVPGTKRHTLYESENDLATNLLY